jgi:hypothetical protein
MDENIESLLNLEENLREYGYAIDDLPIVIQYNKRDLPGVSSVDDLNARLNKRGWPWYEASATIGNGVFDTLKLIIKLVLEKAKKGGTAAGSGRIATASASGKIRQPDPTTPPAAPETPAPTPQPTAVAEEQVPAASPAQQQAQEPSPEPPMEARPFPGDQSGGIPARKVETAQPSTATANKDEPGAPADRPVAETPTRKRPKDLTTPSMAPPLRRRPKKRGFFKRLFGIK